MLEHERRLGIRQKNGKPSHPQTQGKVRRFQQTLKNWLRAQPVQPATIGQADGLSREASSLTAVSYLIGHGAGMHTAPEAARVIARTLALTCADCTNGGGGSGGRSAHVPDHHLSGLG